MDLIAILQLLLKWAHVFAAILWIGQTYLFNFMERSLEPSTDEPNLVGRLWMVHGGGFYLVEKQRRPELMPMTLHWFKWEAASTWVTGVLLLIVTYYLGGLVVEPGQSMPTAVAVGVGVMVVGWFVYDLLVRSPLGRHPRVFAGVGLFLVVVLHALLDGLMGGRSAFIHVGAVLGTIMAANVWMRILPAQRRMIAAAERGEAYSDAVAATGPLRSRHNSYLVIPLVLIMLSNHYPTLLYGNPRSTLMLGVVLVVGVAAAHVFRLGGFRVRRRLVTDPATPEEDSGKASAGTSKGG